MRGYVLGYAKIQGVFVLIVPLLKTCVSVCPYTTIDPGFHCMEGEQQGVN
jgi:hypothetical protein